MECSRWIQVALAAVLTYCGFQMVGDNESGLWAVILAEWVVNVAPFVLWEAYCNFRLWCVSDTVLAQLRVLDFLRAVGSERNVVEFGTMMVHVEAVYWRTVPAEQAMRGSRRADFSPGGDEEGDDYVKLDPHRPCVT